MFHGIASVLFSTPVFIAGAAGYCGLVDVSTQFTEHKYKRRVAEEAAERARQRQASKSQSSITREEEEELLQESEEWELDTARTARMTGLGLVSGVFSIGFFSLVNAAVTGDRTFGNALKKAVVGACVIGPPLFVMQVTANELLLRGHFRTAWPKVKQEFLPSCALSLLYLPFSVLGFCLFESPVFLILFNAPISFVFNMGMNYLMNRKLQGEPAAENGTSANGAEKMKKEAPEEEIATAEQTATGVPVAKSPA